MASLAIWAMCCIRAGVTMILSFMEKIMEMAAQGFTGWDGLSSQIADTVEAVQDGIVTVLGGGRWTSSGVVWRPGVVVTVRQGIRRKDALQVAHQGAPLQATLAGADATTDLAVLRVDHGADKPVNTEASTPARVGEIVLAVGRSGLGDISASAGIIARLAAHGALGGVGRSTR